MAELDKLPKEEELKEKYIYMYAETQVTKKRNLLLENLHT